MTVEALKRVACIAIVESSKDLSRLSYEIWSLPELCFEEYHAHEVLTTYLEENKFDVQRKFVTDTGFKAELGSNKDGLNIAVICKYDALPEYGHACGHNLIAEAGVAAGIGIAAAFKQSEKPLVKYVIDDKLQTFY